MVSVLLRPALRMSGFVNQTSRAMDANVSGLSDVGPLAETSLRFLFYSHDGLGLGHTRRHLAVAKALTALAPDASVLLATGADEISQFGADSAIDVLKLPGLRKVANERYASRRLQIPVSEIRALRSALLLAAVKTYRPTVVLVDKHPFGAKGEFRDGLEKLHALGGSAVLGLRDILDDPPVVLKEWSVRHMQERMLKCYDLVLVYGQRSVFDPVTEYQFPSSLADRTRFCGYVINPDDDAGRNTESAFTLPPPDGVRPLVLATAGGGEDGFFLLQMFIRSAAHANWQGVVVTGPMTPERELNTLKRLAAESRVVLHTFVPNLSSFFQSVHALVCMGGYNTLVEAMFKGVPTICVPRIEPRREQWIRARAFEQLGLLTTMEPECLTAEGLDAAITSSLKIPRQKLMDLARPALGFDGARQAALHLLELASSPECRTLVTASQHALAVTPPLSNARISPETL